MSATSAIIGGILLLGRSPVPTKVFASPKEAAPWLAPLLSKPGEFAWTPEWVVSVCGALTA